MFVLIMHSISSCDFSADTVSKANSGHPGAPMGMNEPFFAGYFVIVNLLRNGAARVRALDQVLEAESFELVLGKLISYL